VLDPRSRRSDPQPDTQPVRLGSARELDLVSGPEAEAEPAPLPSTIAASHG
jgi:hypothetical protein